ncbi:MAG: AAA family ATPase [Bacteriovoracaceae bacterium]|nr:AAA family ATPase [Bacteriovoracaceae bacterium]
MSIRGPAGAGKSTVALRRAYVIAKSCIEDEDNRRKILLTTFNAKLADSLNSQMDALLAIKSRKYGNQYIEKLRNIITIDHIDSLISKTYLNRDEGVGTGSAVSFFVKAGVSFDMDEECSNWIRSCNLNLKGKLLFLNASPGGEASEKIRNKLAKGPFRIAKNGSLYLVGTAAKSLYDAISNEKDENGDILKKMITDSKQMDKKLKEIIDESVEESKCSKFLRCLPFGFYRALFEMILVQTEMTKEYFCDIQNSFFEFHNMHNKFTQKDRESIWEIFVSFKTKIDAQSELLSYSQRAMLAIDKIQELDTYDYVIVDESQDLGMAKTEFAINLLKSMHSESKRVKGLTLLMDSSQSLYNPLFHYNEVYPCSIHYGLKNGSIEGQKTSRNLTTVFRNPEPILRAAEIIKDKMHRMAVKGVSLEDVGASGEVGFPEEFDDLDNGNILRWQVLGMSKKSEGESFWSYKGREHENIYFKDFGLSVLFRDLEDLQRNIKKEYPDIYHGNISRMFNEIFKMAITSGTKETRQDAREKVNFYFKDSLRKEDRDVLERLSIYFLILIDRVLCHLYVGLTRTKQNFAISFREGLPDDIKEGFFLLMKELKKAA